MGEITEQTAARRPWAVHHAHELNRRWRRLTPRERLGASAALLLLVAITAFLLLFHWNMLRGPIGGYLSGKLHRRVQLVGDLEVHPWSFKPKVTVNDFRIGQPAWAGTDDMARVRRLTIQLKLLPLLRGQTILPLVLIDQPDVKLLREKDGRSNWSFDKSGSGSKLPAIQKLVIRDGRLALDDAPRGIVFRAKVESSETVGDRKSVV